MARNRPTPRGEHEPRVGHYDWKATVPGMSQCGSWGRKISRRRLGGARPRPRRPRVATLRTASAGNKAAPRRGGAGTAEATGTPRKQNATGDYCEWQKTEYKNTDTRSFGKGDQPGHIQLSAETRLAPSRTRAKATAVGLDLRRTVIH